MNSRLVEMIARGRLPLRGGQWIDTYNQITDPDCAGTIIAGINAKNHYFIMEEQKPIVAGELTGERWDSSFRTSKTVYNPDGVAPTILSAAGCGGGTEIKIIDPIVLGWTRDEKGNVVDRHPVEVANAVTAGKRENTQNYVIEQRGHGFVPSSQKQICPTITGATFKDNNTLNNGYRIRKLTPRECFRLMGVSDADIDKIQAAGISKSQQYKMAGNSIVVNCLAAIFRQLFIGNFNKVQQTEIF